MASIINASNSAGVVISPDTSGNLTIQSNGNTVVTITATGVNAGMQVASWGAPAFSVTNGGVGQTVSNATFTKLVLNAKDFDTANAFDASTNYRFQPTIAGYYQFNSFVSGPSSNTQNTITALYKNGSIFRYLGSVQNLNANAQVNDGVSGALVTYLNGSTDYIELWVFQQTGGSASLAGSAYLNGFLARSA